MHECPTCHEACACDAGQPGRDVWTEPPADCTHACDPADVIAFLRGLFSSDD